MRKIQGGCLCGAIRYQSTSEPTRMIASDCRHCQKQAGAAIAISVGVPANTLKVKGKRPSVYEDTRASGVSLRSFCPDCGTPLFSESEAEPEMVFIIAATLDDPSWVQPQVIYSAGRFRQVNQSATREERSPERLDRPVRELRIKVS